MNEKMRYNIIDASSAPFKIHKSNGVSGGYIDFVEEEFGVSFLVTNLHDKNKAVSNPSEPISTDREREQFSFELDGQSLSYTKDDTVIKSQSRRTIGQVFNTQKTLLNPLGNYDRELDLVNGSEQSMQVDFSSPGSINEKGIQFNTINNRNSSARKVIDSMWSSSDKFAITGTSTVSRKGSSGNVAPPLSLGDNTMPVDLTPPVVLDHWWHRNNLVLLGLADNDDVTVWPAGNGDDLIHDEASSFAKFRTADGGYLEISNTGTQLLQAAGVVNAQPTTVFIYSDFSGITGSPSSGAVFDGISSRNHLFVNSGGTNFSMFAGSIVDCGVPADVASKRLVTCVFNGAASVAYANNTKGSTISVGASGLNGFRLGANNTKANTGAQKTRFVGILYRVPTDQEVKDMHDYCVAQFG